MVGVYKKPSYEGGLEHCALAQLRELLQIAANCGLGEHDPWRKWAHS